MEDTDADGTVIGAWVHRRPVNHIDKRLCQCLRTARQASNDDREPRVDPTGGVHLMKVRLRVVSVCLSNYPQPLIVLVYEGVPWDAYLYNRGEATYKRRGPWPRGGA